MHKAAIYIVKENILFWSVGDWCQLGQELKESDQMTIKTHLVEGCCWGGGGKNPRQVCCCRLCFHSSPVLLTNATREGVK